jgi:hypothetical protein
MKLLPNRNGQHDLTFLRKRGGHSGIMLPCHLRRDKLPLPAPPSSSARRIVIRHSGP